MTLVDTNVILDLVTDDPLWFDWSMQQLQIASIDGGLAINDVVYAEASVRFSTMEAVEGLIDRIGCTRLALPKAALFMAGKAFQRYRAGGGTRTGVLSDFFIGAHAAVTRMKLLSRDPRRFRTYFPTVELVTPYTS